jgi:hypothetical protein
MARAMARKSRRGKGRNVYVDEWKKLIHLISCNGTILFVCDCLGPLLGINGYSWFAHPIQKYLFSHVVPMICLLVNQYLRPAMGGYVTYTRQPTRLFGLYN